MHLFKKYLVIIGLLLTFVIGLFPDFFAILGQLIITLFKNYWLPIMLSAILFLLIFICNLCVNIKEKQEQTEKVDKG